MKHLLLFFQHKLAKRLKELSTIRPVVCWSTIYGYIVLLSAKEYVLLIPGNPGKKLTNPLFVKPSMLGLIHLQNPGFLYECYMLFLRAFNADIQQITTRKTFAVLLFLIAPKTSYSPSQRRRPSLLKTIRQTLFYEQPDEHFYRLRSLIEHTPKSYRYKKRPEKSSEVILGKI